MKKYELFKTILLFLLVIISAVLTWNLWTYQPAYDEIENTEYIQQDIMISSNKRELEDHLRPTTVLYHKEDGHYGSTKEEHITKWMAEMKKWGFHDIRNISDSVSRNEFLSFVHGKDSLEIIYPDTIPIQTFQLMFQMNEKSLPSIYFDHIVLKLKEGHEEGIHAYFVDYDRRKIYEASVENGMEEDLERINKRFEGEYSPYISYNVNDVRSIFLPTGPMEVNRIQYYTDKIETEKFRDALFSDPSYVKKESLAYSDSYTDGSRFLEVDSIINVMVYVNPVNIQNENMESDQLLKRSFSFVNDHGGWTDTYRFASWDRTKQEVVYRLYEDNYPVFNSQGMTEVYQLWGSTEILRYSRPIYRFIKLPLDSYPVRLTSGEEIIKKIKSQPKFDPLLLKDIVVGYKLIREDPTSKVVSLEPSWFYLYDQTWQEVEEREEGGNIDGLE
ncbi:regulatory protein YycH of two-component signal transduction system YycFG [Bacillus fengqiuensis]|nr:regulatory protein YycH of two-component signal transduction system YycFG [Bacillus fengqiuensis]